MKKLLKILAVLAAIAAVLLIGALIALKIMFPPEKVKTLAQNYVRQNFHREIVFSDVSFNLIGVTLKDFALSNHGSFDPDGTFAKADRAIVKVALKPLFKKRIEISTIGLDGLDITISKDQQGNFNFDDFLTAENSPQKTENAPTPTTKNVSTPQDAAQAAPFVITAERIYANNCNLFYRDLQSGMDASVTRLNLQINQFDMQAPFEVDFSFTTDYQDNDGLTITIPVKASLQVALANAQWEKAYAVLEQLTLNYQEIAFQLSAKADNFLNQSLDLKGSVAGLSDKALADVAQELPNFILPSVLFSAKAKLDLNASSAKIEQAKLSIQDSSITAKGNMGWGSEKTTYQIKTDLALNLGQIAQMSTLTDGFGLGGKISGQITASDKNQGQDVKGTLTMKDLAVQYPPFSLAQLNGQVILNSLNDISTSELTALFNNEKLTASFAYKNLADILDLVINLDLAKFTLQTFSSSQKDETDTPKTEEKNKEQNTTDSDTKNSAETFFNIKADIKVGEIAVPYFSTQGIALKADLKKASASMKQANGQVGFELQQGAITDLDSFVKENKIVKILLLPFSLINKVSSKLGVEIFPIQSKEDKGKIKFTSGNGAYRFTNGLMTIENTSFISAISNMKAGGSLDFKTEALDMKVSATILTSQTPVVIKIGGTMSNPSGKLDVASTAVSLVGGILNYKTPIKVAKTTGQTTQAVVTKTTDTAVGAVNTAVDAVKSIGSLFKSKKKEEKEDKAQ